MNSKKTWLESFEQIRKDLRGFIELSMEEDEKTWGEWVASVAHDIQLKCWEYNQCQAANCPAYKNACGRCWLIAGTMCGGEVTGKFAQKYQSCRECGFYQLAVYQDPLGEISEHLIILVHNLRMKQDELKQQAITDPLTGLHNRRYFNLCIDREVAKMQRAAGRLTFVMIDVNHFKIINDTKGHGFGDHILRECAQILKQATRATDLLIRFGGDEFLIVLVNDSHSVNAFMARLEEAIRSWNALNQAEDVTLSFSAGVACMKSGDQIKDILEEADRNMYRDKLKMRPPPLVDAHLRS